MSLRASDSEGVARGRLPYWPEVDFAVQAAPEDPLAYAGLVLEQLGFVRWAAARETDGLRGRLVLVSAGHDCHLERLPAPSLIELRSGEIAGELPLGLKVGGALRTYCAPVVGLYTALSNYNGMKGVTETFAVPAAQTFRRARALAPPQGLSPLRPLQQSGIPVFVAPGEPLVETTQGVPVVSRMGPNIVLGLPLPSLLVSHLTAHTFPSDAYSFSDTVHHLLRLFEGLVEMLAPAGTVRVRAWPRKAPAAFCVRHDYDRPCDLEAVAKLEREGGLRPSVHVLADTLPSARQVEAVLDAGGEVGLHTRFLGEIGEDIRRIEGLTGRPVSGCSAHGGTRSDGWQGAYNLAASHEQGLLYTELLSEMHVLPHRIPDATRAGCALGPIAMPHHLSFDVRRGADDGERIRAELGRLMGVGGLLTLMNHPDMNLEGFLDLCSEVLGAGYVHMTLEEAARWWRATHTQGCLDLSVQDAPGGARVSGRIGPEQLGAVVEVFLDEEQFAGRDAGGVAGAPGGIRYTGLRHVFEVTLDEPWLDGSRVTLPEPPALPVRGRAEWNG